MSFESEDPMRTSVLLRYVEGQTAVLQGSNLRWILSLISVARDTIYNLHLPCPAKKRLSRKYNLSNAKTIHSKRLLLSRTILKSDVITMAL